MATALASGPSDGGRWAIPQGWSWLQAKDFSKVIGGGTPKNAADPANYSEDGTPWLTPADLSRYTLSTIERGRRSLSAKGLAASSARLLPKGTVLISSRAPVGYCAVAATEVTTNQGFRSLVCGPDIDPFFVRYYLLLSRRYLEESASGTTFNELSGTALGELLFPVPPLEIQHRIVARIDELFSELDDGEEELRRARVELETYRKSLLKAAVTGELTADWRAANPPKETGADLLQRILADRRARWEAEPRNKGKRYKEPAGLNPASYPELPDRWSWASLAQLADLGTGSTPSRSEPGYWNGDIPWLKSGCVNSPVVRSADEFVSEVAVRAHRLKFFEPGTLLMALYGEGKTRGRTTVLGIRSTINQALGAIAVVGMEPLLVKAVLDSGYQKNRLVSSGGVQPNFNMTKLGNLPIPVPPLDEQRVILDRLSAGLASEHELAEAGSDAGADSAALRQSILAAAFRGELVQ